MTTTSGVAAYLTVHNAAEAIAFYQQAFGATEVRVGSAILGERLPG